MLYYTPTCGVETFVKNTWYCTVQYYLRLGDWLNVLLYFYRYCTNITKATDVKFFRANHKLEKKIQSKYQPKSPAAKPNTIF